MRSGRDRGLWNRDELETGWSEPRGYLRTDALDAASIRGVTPGPDQDLEELDPVRSAAVEPGAEGFDRLCPRAGRRTVRRCGHPSQRTPLTAPCTYLDR